LPRLLVTLCTYNERENIARLVPEIHRHVPDADVLVVDDASPDGTGKLADEMAAADPRVKVLHRTGKLGLGSATVAAFRYGLAEGYDLLVNMDADFSHPPSQIPVLVALSEQAEVAIGSRYVPGGEIIGWRPLRHVMSRGVNLLSRNLLGLAPRDTSGSFRCYRMSVLRRIDFDRIVAKGYAFEEEILYRCRRAGATFIETPIRFEDRRAGESKINAREVTRALRDLGILAVENVLGGGRGRETAPRDAERSAEAQGEQRA
jgi:dolichol-phosphate mannosyltransferase